MDVSYNPTGTIIAFVLIIFGAYTALALAKRARAVEGTIRLGWLAASSFALGFAIWSMHFIAIVATRFAAPVALDVGEMMLPLVTAVPLIGSAFLPLCRARPGPARVILAGVIMGFGICVLHYLGLAAITGVVPTYDPLLVAASAFLAAGSCTLMLLLAVRQQGQAGQIVSSIGLGAAIAATHYVGMSATCFHADLPLATAQDFPVRWVAAGIASATVLLFAFALLAILFDRYVAEMAARETALIRSSEQRLRNILEQLPLGIGIADVQTGRLTIINRHAHKLLGANFDPSSLEPPALEGSAERDPSAELAPFASALRGGFVGGRLVDYQGLEGRRSTLEVWAAPVFNATGDQDHAVYAFQDVTSRLRAEAELRQAQKMEAVGQLTGGIAHDFNNLLTAVLGNLDLLDGHLDGDPARTLLRNAIDATERGARLTSQLLGFSRRQSLRPEPVDLNQVVAGMTDLLASTLGGTVQIRTIGNEDLWPALADRTQLELVILNLAINARDAMPLGGTILIRTENVRTDAPVAGTDPPAGEHVLLSVSDDGDGMPAETLARVFEPFFTTKPPGKGSGLGLSQVLGIAQQLGGGVRIRSEPFQGTTVQLFMPRGAAAAAAAEQQGPGPRATETLLAGRTILLVDDDRDVRIAACATLTLFGCTVIEGSSGRAAIDLLAEHGDRIDLVMMDYAMPGMTGLEAAERIRAVRPSLPVLLVTGYADPEMLGSAAEHFPVLGKPFRSAQLASRLGSLLESSLVSSASVVRFPQPRPRVRPSTSTSSAASEQAML